MQQQKNGVAPKSLPKFSKNAPNTHSDNERSHNNLSRGKESRTPSSAFMFISMSSGPGERAKIQPTLRASAKAHVMHDYQRKTAQKRLAKWKMSTPKSYSLAPKEPSVAAPIRLSPSFKQEVVGWENVVFQIETNRSEPKVKSAPSKRILSRRSTPSPVRMSSRSSTQTSTSHLLSPYSATVMSIQPNGSNLLDVFLTLPFQVQSWDETLISRWLHYDRIPWCPVNGQSPWISFVMQSPVLLHANLYSWGMHWHGKLTGSDQDDFLKQNPQILEHKIAAIQMVNTSIQSQAMVTDEVLAAVAIFINVSMQFLNRGEAVSHMAGLKTLVNLRGGLEILSELGTVGILLQRMISWNDLFFVELFGGDLRFSLLPRFDEAWHTVFAPLEDDPVTHLEPLQARFAGDCAREVTILLREMQLVCNDVQARPLRTLTTREKTLRHDTLFRFERRLCLATRITSIADHDHDEPQQSTISMWRAVAYAALMFVHHHMRPDYALHWAQFRALTVQLRGELSSTRIENWNAAPALHLWVLFVGSWVSQREDWILQDLANACRMRGCMTEEAFHEVLNIYPSMGKADEEKVRTIWRDVAQRFS